MNSPTGFEVPNSVGVDLPKLTVSANACDAHIHIYDERFPHIGECVKGATVADYQLFQKRIGTSKVVIVNPRVYGTDNSVTLDAIRQLGIENARGIAVITPDIKDSELERLNSSGIRGVRFTLFNADNAPTTFNMVEPIAERIRDLGWHLQLHWTADQIVEHEHLIGRLKAPIVFDHLARIPVAAGLSHPAFNLVASLLESGRAWLKLSGAYLDSQLGPEQNYSDLDDVARAFVRIAPERLVWGSDWPHPTEQPPKNKPNDAQLLDLLSTWVSDSKVIEKILVSNPHSLYQFN